MEVFLRNKTILRSNLTSHDMVSDGMPAMKKTLIFADLYGNILYTEKGGQVMKYNFYGGNTVSCTPIKDIYKNIHSPQALYDLLCDIWCVDTCAPRLRQEWTPENKTKGQCSITAFLAQDIFGGKVFGIPLGGEAIHCYNVVREQIFDLTSEQFGEKASELQYKDNPEQFREIHFAKEEKRLRYEYLKKTLEEYLKK